MSNQTDARWKLSKIVKYGPSLKLAIPDDIAAPLSLSKGVDVLVFVWGDSLIVQRIENPHSPAGAARIHEVMKLMPASPIGRKPKKKLADSLTGNLPLTA